MGENQEKVTGKAGKVPLLRSMRMKMILFVMLGALCSCIMVLWITVPRAEEELTTLTQNSLLSLAKSYAVGMQVVIAEVQQAGKEMDYNAYATILDGAGMEGVESSYAYMVSPEGTMLYHPTQSKVGQPVENEVVKGVVSKIRTGIIPKPEVVSYDFNAEVKYAAYYMLSPTDIIVISTD
ncbi:MAG: hypothetical protein K2P64_06480, partial [Lachnospiraceae bacterium]|nr:hypothetical protein [Lachnospiraceae bacterium]